MPQPDDGRRTWNTDTRAPWNASSHSILKAVDNHVDIYLKTSDPWHERQASILRAYVLDLKQWLKAQEGKVNNPDTESHL